MKKQQALEELARKQAADKEMISALESEILREKKREQETRAKSYALSLKLRGAVERRESGRQFEM